MDVSGNALGRGAEARGSSRGYRPDIDGLRAVAVMLVVLDHVGFKVFAGGYIGVDVFMVISGFLITGMITAQRSEGQFRFIDFYVRRAKRLLPALYVMMLAVLVAGYWVMIPSDFNLLAQSALSAVALVANAFFWIFSGGYFAPDAASMPLLHIWSLSLEEQFYLFWPAILISLLKLPSERLRLLGIGLLTAASFAFAQYCIGKGFTSAYFLLPQRGGEFLIGALLALVSGRPVRPNAAAANGLGVIGLVLIFGSAFLLDATTPFPGLSALAPCLGAAMAIAAPKFGANLGSRVLSVGPFVFVGLISYSVYLWHWPLIAFLRYQGTALTILIALGLIAASLVLGYLSWRFIETSYRASLHKPGIPARLVAGVATTSLIAFSAVIIVRDGMPGRFPYALPSLNELLAERDRYWHDLPGRQGALDPSAAGKRVLIVGDSHAYDLAYALSENGLSGRVKLVETFHECFNFGHDAVLPKSTSFCAERRAAVLSSPDLPAATMVILHDSWAGENFTGLVDMIAQVRSRTAVPIYVFGPKMTFNNDALGISRAAQAQHRVTAGAINDLAQAYRKMSRVSLDSRLKAYFATHPMAGVTYVSSLDISCGEARRCNILSDDGKYLYFDHEHFTLLGSQAYGRKLKTVRPEIF